MPRGPAPLAAVLAAVVAAIAAGCGLGSEDRVGADPAATPHTLSLLNPFAGPDELTDFVDEVARLSGGALRIRIVSAGHAGRPDFETATIQDMLNGRADLAVAPSRAWDEFGVLSLRALNAPLLIDSYALQERVLQSSLAGRMLDELEKLNLVGIGILPGAMQRPLGIGHRLAAPDDFRGLTVGNQPSRVTDAVLRALGARPAPLTGHVRNANGLDGVVGRTFAMDTEPLDVPGLQLTANVVLWPRPLVLVASGSNGRLSADERKILRMAATNLVSKVTTHARAGEVEASGNMCRRGGTVFVAATAAELRKLRLAVDPVLRDLERDPQTRAAIEEIQTLKAQLAQPPSELPACERTGRKPPASTKTPIDGVWRMKTGPEAAGTEGLAENWGDWVYVFDRGKFAITQQNAQACTWGYGAFTVVGTQIALMFTDGGGTAPNGAQNKPGEHFDFGFSAYHDTLTVTPVEGAVSPINFRAKPWRQLSSTPSRKFFSKRCPPPAAALPEPLGRNP